MFFYKYIITINKLIYIHTIYPLYIFLLIALIYTKLNLLYNSIIIDIPNNIYYIFYYLQTIFLCNYKYFILYHSVIWCIFTLIIYKF